MKISGTNVDINPSFSSGASEITENLWKNLRKNAIATAAKRMAQK